MSCFDVQILDPNINTVEIETCIGDQPSSINIITYDNTNILEINNCIALLPSEINDLIIVKNILAGSGIAVISSSGIYTISLNNPNLISSDISDFLESVQDIIGQSGLNTGDYVNLNYNDITGLTTISVTGLQPSGNYSVVGHTHTSNNITDFTSSVSGLLPSITGVGQASSSFLNNVYSISVTGLQPSGNYSLVGHTHTSSNITDFNSSVSGLLPVKNISAGSGIGISSASGDFTVSVTGSFGLTSEQVDDRISNLLVAGNYVNLNYNDSADILTVSVTGVQPSGNYSIIGHSHVISDVSGLQNALDSKQPSGNYANFVHVHTSSDITDFNSSVSGLLPVKNIIGSGYVNISSSSGNFTVSVNGLQPSGNYANSAHTHTSSQITDFNTSVSGLLTPYATINSPNFSGIPTAPTATSGTNNSQIANTQFVRTEISNLVNSAPSTLDTLNELATALGNDPNFATTVTNSLASKAALSGAIFTGPVTIPSGTGNFNNLTINGINVSVSGHTHTSSNITDFNSSVSGLLPVTNILSGVGISVSNSSGVYTIEATGSGILSDQAKSLVTTVFNKTGSPIPKMTAVYINGGQGDLPTVSLAIATSDMTSAGTYGLTYETIPNMQSGQVIVFGALTGLNTDQFNPTAPQGDVNGSVLYLSPSVSGSLTLTKPGAPNHIVAIGTIVRTHQNEGVIEVRVQNGFELEELHNVAISGATNGQFLQYNSGTQLWVPSSSGNFSTLQVNGTGVSISGHTHTSSSITDFNSSVSGLLPSISGSTYITSNFNNNVYTISVSGLQPSGDYSVVGHNHTIITKHSLQSDLNALALSGINYTYIFNTGAEESSLVLPTAVNNTSIYTLKNNTDGIIYIKTSNSETVDNYSPTPSPSGTVIGLNIKYSSIMLISDNSGWLIV